MNNTKKGFIVCQEQRTREIPTRTYKQDIFTSTRAFGSCRVRLRERFAYMNKNEKWCEMFDSAAPFDELIVCWRKRVMDSVPL